MFAIRGDVCHLCGHSGAKVADHVIPFSVRPDLVADPDNMRPAHGPLVRHKKGPLVGQVLRDDRCPTCVEEGKSGACNGNRGAKPLAEYIPPVKLDGSDRNGAWDPSRPYVPAVIL